jgi:multiple sugar transport system ATP-binding protein
LKLAQGQRFNLGIRLEHIQIASSTTHLMVEVTLVEPLGREILVRAMLLGENRGKAAILSIQMSPMARPKVGDRLPLQLDLDYLCIFDPMTGKNLSVIDPL